MPNNLKLMRSFDLAGVYLIRNKSKRKVYIGSSRDVIGRIKSHEHALVTHTHPNKAMQADFDSGDCFYYEFLYCEPMKDGRTIRDKLYRLERHYIEQYNSIEKGYNKQRVCKTCQLKQEVS